ncbi:MAG: acylphosphatase [Bacteroidales bacterium]|nr:acylphosphatase [Bacteroidales bacterium]
MIKHFNIIISGDLQHKGYKLRMMMLASQHRIKGSVEEKNEEIVVEAEGEEADINGFFQAIKHIQPAGAGKSIIHKNETTELSYFDEFIIR